MYIKPAGYSFVTFLLLLVAGCTKAPVQDYANNTGIAAWENSGNSDELERLTRKALSEYGRDLVQGVPRDIDFFCPQYASANPQDRQAFWLGLISSLAYFESNHSSATRYTENFSDVAGRPVISRGLLQISIESANWYGCQITDATQLHHAPINISCGVRILNKWVGQEDKVIADSSGWLFNNSWSGAARYWSPFRDANKKRRIASATRALPLCKDG